MITIKDIRYTTPKQATLYEKGLPTPVQFWLKQVMPRSIMCFIGQERFAFICFKRQAIELVHNKGVVLCKITSQQRLLEIVDSLYGNPFQDFWRYLYYQHLLPLAPRRVLQAIGMRHPMKDSKGPQHIIRS